MTRLISTASLLQGTVDFKELTLKQYRQLLKCFLGDEVYPELIVKNTDNIIRNLTSLSSKQIKSLNYLDYCLLLFNIRQVSIGDTVSLYAQDLELKQLKIDLKISRVIDEINKVDILSLIEAESIGDITIEYKLPTVREIMLLEQEKNNYSIYTFFLKSIKLANKTINFEDYNYQQKEEIAQKIPVRVTTALTKRSHSIIERCNSINIFEFLDKNSFDKELNLSLNSQIIFFIIKLIYNTSLESIYELMFALSKAANMSPIFLDECSPGEFYFFTKKLEEISAKQSENALESSSSDILPPIESEFQLE